MVSFTGSTRAGKRVAELASQSLKRVALELGGKSANILLDDLDDGSVRPRGPRRDPEVLPELRARRARRSPACSCRRQARRRRAHRGRGGRVEVPARRPVRRRRDPRAALVAGAGRAGQRLHPEGHRRGRQARHRRHRASRRGSTQGYFVKPTVFSNVSNDMTIAQEEIFGPVLSIIPYGDEEDAVAHRQRQQLRPVGWRVVGRRGARQEGCSPHPDRADRGERRGLQPERARSVATSSPATAASTASTASRSSSRSRRCSSNRLKGRVAAVARHER